LIRHKKAIVKDKYKQASNKYDIIAKLCPIVIDGFFKRLRRLNTGKAQEQ